MTDEKINIAIAEACGWKGNLIDRDMEGNLWPRDIPSYCNDLNAMHVAEETLGDPAIRREYSSILGCLVKGYICLDAIYATARQRAEAFLKTIGKWEQ